MSAEREGFDLFNPTCRANVRRRKWKHIPWRLVFDDTFLPLICRVIGHDEYDCTDPPERGQEFACRRCHHFTRHITYQPKG